MLCMRITPGVRSPDHSAGRLIEVCQALPEFEKLSALTVTSVPYISAFHEARQRFPHMAKSWLLEKFGGL